MKIRSKIGDIKLPQYNIELSDKFVEIDVHIAQELSELKFIEVQGTPIKTAEKDINSMTKDELLDYTAIHGIEADYKMSKSRLITLIKNKRGIKK